MHPRRFATLLLGAWLGGCAWSGWVATHNLRAADSIVKEAGFQARKTIDEIGDVRARRLLRYHSAELNRHYFFTWELIEFVFAAALGTLLLFTTNGNRLLMALVSAMFLIVVVQHFTLTPQMTELGRGLDFAGPDELIEERRSFRGYHELYGYLALAKLALGLGLVGRLMFASGNGRRRRSRKVDVVDHADHSHVDG